MKNSVTPVFATLFLIITWIVSCYALLKTSFVSFNIALLCYCIFYSIWYKKNYFNRGLLSKEWLIVPFVFVFFWTLEYVVFFNSQVNFPNLPHNDVLHYLSISNGLNQFGQENFFRFKNELFHDFNGVVPYHYFDLWLNAFFSSLFSINSFYSWNLIMHPLLIMICALAFMSLYEVQSKLDWKGILLAIGFCFYSGLPIEFPKLALGVANPFLFCKSIVPYFFIILSIIFFFKDLKRYSVVTLLVLTWIYPTVAPGIYIGLTLFTACAYLLKREGWNFNFLLIALFLSAGLQLAFYKIFGSGLAPESSTSAVPMSWPEILLSMKAYASQGIKIITRYVFPVALVYFFARKTFMLSAIEKRALEFFVIIGFGGLLFAGLPQHSMVASQLGANLMGPILIVFSFIMFQKVITATPHPSKLSIAVIGILLASCFLLSLANGVYSKPSRIERYSRDYLASVSAFVTKSKNKLGVFIADSSFFDGVLNKNEDYHYLGKYLKLVSPDTYVFNLMPDQLHLNLRDNTERMFYQRSVYSLLHKKYPLIQSDSLRIQMLYELNPSFLLTSKNIAIPDYIKKHLSDSIVDKKSGERFFIIESNRR